MKLLALPRILRFVMNHPLNREQKGKAVIRFIRWQIGSRLVPGSVVVRFVEGSRLLVTPGMTGATGNIYTGLHEFEDMSFVLHSLREGDRFVDVGANVGSYTVLASAVVGAECIAIEPVPTTFKHLRDNVNLNGIHEVVQCLNLGVSSKAGTLKFTSTLDTVNRVVLNEDTDASVIDVPVESLDEIAGEFRPSLIKIDVEGFETEVISGATSILRQENLFAVIIELTGAGERYGFDELALHRRMIDYGFNPYSYFPLNRKLLALEGKNTSSGNTLYIRNINLVTERIQTAPRFSVNDRQV